MKHNETHISSYNSNAIVLIALLVLTSISVLATGWHIGAFTVALALLIASVKVSIVIYNFMHVKHESLFIKLMILGVFVLYALVIIITFIDYYLR
ncbi:MAG: cytochrome C oxidase subunit IV family protein [Bacteroidales bacterium]|nr:cytochrome C oxidase subunit IV family protein [Bacteroidales bacterium]MBK7625913.1 cytochrome C oxidase subunit IV family protein [Bacteroidales bacterium]